MTTLITLFPWTFAWLSPLAASHLGVCASYVCIGLLFVGLALPLIRRRVPPNRYYGFRTPKTLASRTTWYAANEVAGRALLVAGVVVSLGSLLLYPLARHLPVALHVVAELALLVVATAWAMRRSLRALDDLL